MAGAKYIRTIKYQCKKCGHEFVKDIYSGWPKEYRSCPICFENTVEQVDTWTGDPKAPREPLPPWNG